MSAATPNLLNPHPTVLVIEDEPGDAHLIRRQLLALAQDAYLVHLARSMAEARALIDQQGLRPDVVLLDLNLPDSHGIDTVESCRLLVEAPIIVLTGLDDTLATQSAIQSGAEDYLTKGCEVHALHRAVRYAMLRHLRDADARLAATVFAHARESIVITDTQGMIVDVNATFTQVTGFSREEALGRTPRILKSGCHGPDFYAVLWGRLLETGHWVGEVWNRRKDGVVYVASLTISAVYDGRGKVRHYVGLSADITLQKENEKQLKYIAHHDALTRMPNRVLLADRMQLAMAQSQRRKLELAVVYIDLDGFKAINDQRGHQAGDQLLITVADRMKLVLREGDTLARLGGDEFVALLTDLSDRSGCESLTARLLQVAAEPVLLDGVTLQVTASVGVTFFPQPEDVDADQLLRQADQAMYQAKLSGKNRVHYFDITSDLVARGHYAGIDRIREAMTSNELVLYYQPKVDMRTGVVVGIDAQPFWKHPQRGLLPYGSFQGVIEDHPLAVSLGEWAIGGVLQQLQTWQEQGVELPISVNVGARQLQQSYFVDRLKRLLAAYPDVPAHRLELEVLESVALLDLQQLSDVMQGCRALGVSFALDDFGSGYSSLTYLKRLPIAMIKVDANFVRDMLFDAEDLAILGGLMALARAFRRQVVAQGVSTVEQGTMLLLLGCEVVQGDFISSPLPADAVPGWIAQWRTPPVWANHPNAGWDKLPLVCADVEHRSWVRAIEEGLAAKRALPDTIDVHSCRLGGWLEERKRAGYSAFALLDVIGGMHEELHRMANEIISRPVFDSQDQLDERLAALHQLSAELGAHVLELLHEF
ncbi:EAL domain-containing protein [Candidatus Symbiobacter mobilis]|uniref:Signal transduction protein n=1 Tax=Candidatus Symbiobacter mobilis CR TaxID=946483 RepID=U5NAT5_9BURK|nr:EAL domain-containing protein [Candidatus Symbiobacter mobilis]AGX88686.1 signal transduction protein [Candidatus Symbiobacter mobilis CR]